MKRGKIKKAPAAPPIEAAAPVVITKPVPPFTFRVTVHENTRLREGDVVFHDGVRQVVIAVNASCARIRPVTAGAKKTVTFTPRFKDAPVTFNAPTPVSVTSISANSECDILDRLGRDWKTKLAALIK